MADNISITQGSGTATGTDEVAGVHYQKVKWMDPTFGSTGPVSTNQGEASQSTLRIVHAGDVGVSVNASQTGTWNVTSITNPVEVRQTSGASDSVSVLSMPAVTVTSITNSTAVNVVDSSGVSYSGSNPIPITGAVTATGGGYLTDAQLRAATLDVQQVSGANWSTNVLAMPAVIVTNITNSTQAAIVDSTGVQYSGSNPIPTYLVLGSGNSTVSVGPVAHDAVDDGAAPQKVGGTAMTTNPTKVADGDIARFVADPIGRQIITPVQVRGLMQTAYVSVSTGTEATLLAGVSGVFMDLVSVTASTNSTAGVTSQSPIYIDVRSCRTGGIVLSLPLGSISATNTGSASFASKDYNVPLPQDEAGNAWTVDMNDITGTTVNISALFARNT